MRSKTLVPRGQHVRAAMASMLLLIAACTSSSAASPDPSPSTVSEGGSTTQAPSPEPSSEVSNGKVFNSSHAAHPYEFNNINKFQVAPQDMPYPYTTPVPPDEKTPIDGTYMRILTLEDTDGLLPFRCLRCPPYFPNAGVSTLAMSKGNYWVNHQLSGFRALGMYTVEGNRVTFFNDPWCPQDHGTYRWAVEDDELLLEPTSSTCPYEKARTDDFTTGHWIHIRPCIYRIELLWPGPVAC
jgi:hypothetical protein